MNVNEEIKVDRVLLINEDGQSMGTLHTYKALAIAKERGFDLVEVDRNTTPVTCKLINYEKLLYNQKKKTKNQIKPVKIKELWLTPHISTHDADIKVRKACEFLEEGKKVKFVVQFKGREGVHSELGRNVLNYVIDHVGDLGTIERKSTEDTSDMFVLLVPK